MIYPGQVIGSRRDRRRCCNEGIHYRSPRGYGATVPKASPRPLERLRAMLWRVLTGRAQEGVCDATPVYQRAVCSMPASHRKLEAQFSKFDRSKPCVLVQPNARANGHIPISTTYQAQSHRAAHPSGAQFRSARATHAAAMSPSVAPSRLCSQKRRRNLPVQPCPARRRARRRTRWDDK